MSYRNYNSLDRLRQEDEEFGFARRFGSGRYPLKGDNPDLVPVNREFPSQRPTNLFTGCNEPDDDGGFAQRKSDAFFTAERRVVVNSNGTITNSVVENSVEKEDTLLCCMMNPREKDESNSLHWYRSSLMLLLLVVVLAVVLLVTGLLLYFRFYGNDISYRPRELAPDEPCETKYCPFYAVCVKDADGRAVCRCGNGCPSGESPVCGTDGVTYKDLCTLRTNACRNQLNIHVKHPGECHSSDPCRSRTCPYGGRCVPVDGQGTCVCPDRCPNYGDHARSRPVCGTDSVDYANHCELKRAACERQSNVTVKYEGYCDPCSNIKCIEPEICILDPDRNPACRCSETCSLEFAPVCGSDGKTYSNECSLRQQSCRSRKNLRINNRGKCSPDTNPCSSVNCRSNEDCIINKFGIAACECRSDCELIVRPVCGTDGVTYDSFCHLEQSSCRINNNVTLAYNGVCGENGVCTNYHCEFSAICFQVNGQPVCRCPTCTNEFEPVCGSDGITYINLCKLQFEECKHRRHIRVLYEGLCNGCETKQCEFYSVCENDGSGEAKCVCPSFCTKDENAVCGSDGKTYSNECELKVNACRNNQTITVLYKGTCDLCQDIKCNFGARCESGTCVCPSDCGKDLSIPVLDEPVCASDLNTYITECEMLKHACRNSVPALTVLFYGDCKERMESPLLLEPIKGTDLSVSVNHATKEVCQDVLCDYDATCEPSPHGARCKCVFDCDKEPEKPVCGSDLQMYSNLCHMKMKACNKQEEIRIRPVELCQGMEVKPCNGKPPLINIETNEEYDCGSGPNRKDCPSDSYCHHTSKFARCCSKMSGQFIKSCKDSWFGCCPDEKTPAQGPTNAGCPSLCYCNKLGSYSDACEPETGQCKCKPGVGGLKCDRCEPGFWGLPKISSGHPGCLPCGCSKFGSVRDDCEQMTGRCVCKPEIQGPKCTVCMDTAKILGPNGCMSTDVSTPAPTSCDELSCYFGAVCEVHNGIAKCMCHMTCPLDYNSQSQVVCGNDGQTYSSECQLKLYSCKYQKDIAVQALSTCTDDFISGTDGPKLGAWTSVNQYTESDDNGPLLPKSTRHVGLSDVKNALISVKEPIVMEKIVNVNELINEKSGDLYKEAMTSITAFIGDPCMSNGDCPILNTYCSSGICVCKNAFVEASDKRSCSETITLAIIQRACSSFPCLNNGICEDVLPNNYKCICTFPFTGSKCENSMVRKDINIPAFSGQSYIELKQLKAYHKFSVEIEFKTLTNDGILLYSQQRSDGFGDFISLALINGFVEFRYNLGNGPAILTSLQRLTLNTYHKVVAKRYQRDGILQIDGNESVTGQSAGTLKALDLDDNAYIGYVPVTPSKIFENIGTSIGLVGCIRRLKIGRHIVKLRDKHESIVQKVQDIKECSDLMKCGNGTNSCSCFGGSCEMEIDPCSSNPCHRNSVCEPLLQGGYTCNCLPGHRGNSCEIFEPSTNDLYIAQFNGDNSYVKFPCLENVRRGFSIEIWFLSFSQNGVLLYNGQLHNRRGDFISINLVKGHIQFRFDLGSGIANITTDNRIHSSWNLVRIHRFDRVGSVQLNNGSIVRGTSGPPLNELNLELPLYIGGISSLSDVSRESGIFEKFSGAIQRMVINGETLQLLAGEHVNVVPFKGHACASGTCLNGGICVPFLDKFLCKCSSSFKGTHCQSYISDDNINLNYGVYFNGNVYLQYKQPNSIVHSVVRANFTNNSLISDEYLDDIVTNDNSEDDAATDDEYMDDMYDDSSDFEFFNSEKQLRKKIQFEFQLRTSQKSGLLLWSSRIRQSHRDYIAVAIVNGFIEFVHSFGKEQQVLSMKSEETVSDGLWHSVWIHHRKRLTQIRIDNNKPVKLVTDQIHRLFLSSGKIFIGGVPSLINDYPANQYIGFNGCMKELVVDRTSISLVQLSLNSSNIEYCQENDI